MRPERWCCPLYQPFSRFFITNTISPTRNSNSYSLFGGYGTIHRNLWKEFISFRIVKFTISHLSLVLCPLSPATCPTKLLASKLCDFRWWLLPWLIGGCVVAETLIKDDCEAGGCWLVVIACAFRSRLFAALIVKSTLVRRLKRKYFC